MPFNKRKSHEIISVVKFFRESPDENLERLIGVFTFNKNLKLAIIHKKVKQLFHKQKNINTTK